MNTQAKIDELFEVRGLTYFIERMFPDVDERAQFRVLACQLQKAIYALDCYGEITWDTSDNIITELMMCVRNAICDFGVAESAAGDLMSEIETYAKVELQIRRGIDVDMVPLSTFYRLKSCDVRLIRKLASNGGGGNLYATEALWADFDLVTEVIDDLEDAIEDVGTFNGNRWLSVIRRNGIQNARREYAVELTEVRNRFVRQLDRITMDSEMAVFLEKEFELKLREVMFLIGIPQLVTKLSHAC